MALRSRRAISISMARTSTARRASGVLQIGERRLADRDDHDLLALVGRALRVGIEGAEALDAVAVELEPERRRVERREDVDQPAAHAELAAVLDDRHAQVAPRDQVLRELLGVDLVALDEVAHGLLDDGARQEALHHRVGRRDDDRIAAVDQVEERRACGRGRRPPAATPARRPARPTPGTTARAARAPASARILTEKEREIARERLGLGRARREHDERRRRGAIRLGDQQRARAAAQALDAQTLAGRASSTRGARRRGATIRPREVVAAYTTAHAGRRDPAGEGASYQRDQVSQQRASTALTVPLRTDEADAVRFAVVARLVAAAVDGDRLGVDADEGVRGRRVLGGDRRRAHDVDAVQAVPGHDVPVDAHAARQRSSRAHHCGRWRGNGSSRRCCRRSRRRR